MIDKIYCINLPERKDRREKCERQFKELGLEVEFFEGIKNEVPYIGFNKAVYGVISKAYNDGCNNALILEDDVVLRHWSKLSDVLSELPGNYNMLYLGGNVTNDRTHRIEGKKHLFRALDVWTSHAILYSRDMMKFVLDNFLPEGLIYDEWLRTQVQNIKVCHICKPFLAVQEPSWSDIWNCQADYSRTFIDSENKLQ